jgi:hypothetical protein
MTFRQSAQKQEKYNDMKAAEDAVESYYITRDADMEGTRQMNEPEQTQEYKAYHTALEAEKEAQVKLDS